jgi:ParB-like chromosome segregation protein Spo0J
MRTFHEIDTNPETNSKLAEIISSIEANGWQGLPLLAIGDQLYNGCHRYIACEILGVEPEVHQMEIAESDDPEYRQYLIDNLVMANDTQELYNAINELHDEGLVDDLAFEIIKNEWESE